jgi:hypothetical protein
MHAVGTIAVLFNCGEGTLEVSHAANRAEPGRHGVAVEWHIRDRGLERRPEHRAGCRASVLKLAWPAGARILRVRLTQSMQESLAKE